MDNCRTIIVIGASTGGPQTLRKVVDRLPVLDACIIIVQHMPIHVNNSIRRSLSQLTDMEVYIGEDGMRLKNGTIVIAPSEVHLELDQNRTVKLIEGEKVNYVCPSVDVTMKSIQKSSEVNFIGVILTGMGSDGAEGISHVKQLGGMTIAQDEPTSVIYGMPRA
ncbi:MAG: chemotaxis protein CheB, partial [Bacteroidia bacterium]|nr:chemotaxis protein CheB [Bacteroidia bacterium]